MERWGTLPYCIAWWMMVVFPCFDDASCYSLLPGKPAFAGFFGGVVREAGDDGRGGDFGGG